MADAWSMGELAAASGEPEQHLSWLAEVGLLRRHADGGLAADSLHRVRMIRFARGRGVTDERLAAAAARQGDLLGLFEDLAPLEGVASNLVGIARDAGIDEDLCHDLLAVLNVEDPDAGVEDDVAVLRLAAEALRGGLPRDALLQLIRVFVDVMDRLADAENRIFHDYVHERLRAEGLSGRGLLDATHGIGTPLLNLVEPAVLAFHRRAWRRANHEDLLRHLAEETTPPQATPGQILASVMFVDLASFTPLTWAMGDQVAADVLRRFSALVRGTATEHHGRIIKQIGDAFMLIFAEPQDAIAFGLALEERVDIEPQFPALHIGAHHGTVLHRDGDFVGGVVNLAARVASAGAGGQFLITQDLHDAVTQPVEATFVLQPPRPLKGLPEPVRLVQVQRRAAGRPDRATDPVCGMVLHRQDVYARASWHNTEYMFCSATCERAFADNPNRYARP